MRWILALAHISIYLILSNSIKPWQRGKNNCVGKFQIQKVIKAFLFKIGLNSYKFVYNSSDGPECLKWIVEVDVTTTPIIFRSVSIWFVLYKLFIQC